MTSRGAFESGDTRRVVCSTGRERESEAGRYYLLRSPWMGLSGSAHTVFRDTHKSLAGPLGTEL